MKALSVSNGEWLLKKKLTGFLKGEKNDAPRKEVAHRCTSTSMRGALQPKEFVQKVGIKIQKPLTWLRLLDM